MIHLSKSWTLTLIVYAFALVSTIGIVFTDIELTDSQVDFIAQMITMLVGSTTAGGAFVSAMSHRGEMKNIVKEVQALLDAKK